MSGPHRLSVVKSASFMPWVHSSLRLQLYAANCVVPRSSDCAVCAGRLLGFVTLLPTVAAVTVLPTIAMIPFYLKRIYLAAVKSGLGASRTSVRSAALTPVCSGLHGGV